jgi:putative oxidoreductase
MTAAISLGLLVLRVVLGLTVAAHGAQKVFGWFEGPRIQGFAAGLEKMGIRPSWHFAVLAGLSELVGGLLVAVGLLFPIAPLIVIGTLAVAIWTVHYSKGFFNSKGGYEFPFSLAGGMLALSITGPGAVALDYLLRIRLPEPATWIVFAILTALAVVVALQSGRLFGERRLIA